jgi:hypothetical protein
MPARQFGLRHTFNAPNEGGADLQKDWEPSRGSASARTYEARSTVRYLGIEVDDALGISYQNRSNSVDGDNSCMGMWRAHDHGMRQLWQMDIVGEAASAGQETKILLAPNRLTNAVRHGTRLRWAGQRNHKRCCLVHCRPRDTQPSAWRSRPRAWTAVRRADRACRSAPRCSRRSHS